MLEDYSATKQKITCDKCGKDEIGDNDSFFMNGWQANFNAKKYVHICFDCQSKKQKQATKFVVKTFPVSRVA